ncbi:hypothetical protein E1B28_013398 [Marasmius oreades]|uniref:Uncharacterized protein n=1 Tax=Marasmius oreades TaxID=181124 RepID=A0A9P7RPS8_9AGAR|nr:uncharacterized protein E1B28_013398 [Marasmius oreades]KAG7087432.1 hypothetical protein E1B28_013398 [Marasmius oreades]
MTEYDYSPEGYERYLETQRRISRWVDTAEAHRNQFKSPFGARSDVDDSERWDGVDSKSRERDDYRHSRGPSQFYYPSPVPPPPLLLPPPPPPMVAPPNQTWHQTRGASGAYRPQVELPALVITTSSKRKSPKSSKSRRSHKSLSRSKQQTYIIAPPVPPVPTIIVQPPPGQYGSLNSSSVTYISTDHTGYPVTRMSPLHPIPGSVYSYSTPPPIVSQSPGYSNPPPMMSPYTTPAGSPLLPPGSSFHQHKRMW